MRDRDKTQGQLIDELIHLRQRVADLEAAQTAHTWIAQALTQSERKFRKSTEEAVVGVYLVQDNVFRYVNPRFGTIFGYKIDEILNTKGPKDLIFDEDWPFVEERLGRPASEASEAASFPCRGVRKNGEIIFVEVYGSRVEHDGRTAILGTLLDISRRMRDRQRLETERNKFQALYDLAVAMTGQRTLEENLALVAETSRKALGADTAFIALRDEVRGDLYMHTWSGLETEALKRLRIPMGQGHGGKVAETGRRRSLEDYFQEEDPLFHDPVRGEGLISGIAVPIKMGQTNLGVLYVYNRTRTSFSESELDTLSLLGHLAAGEITRKRAEARLRENEARYRELYEEAKKSEQLYRSLLSASADPIVVYDLDGLPTYINAAHTRTFGWTFEELQGKRIPYVPPANWPETNEMIDKVIAGQMFSNQQTRRYTRDCRILDVSVSGSRFVDHEGKTAGFFVILRDISQTKASEEALRKSQEKYRALYEESKRGEELYLSVLNSSADAVVIYDMEGKAQYVNGSFTRIFGWTPEEVVGGRIPFLPESDREASIAIIYDLIHEGKPCSGYETTRSSKDGRLLDVSISASRYHDHEGVPAGMLVVLADITDRKQAEEALRDILEKYRALYVEAESNSTRYRTLLDVSPEPIVVYDIQGLPTYINPAFTRVFGWTFSELEGKRIDFVPAENWPETQRMIDTVLRGETFADQETRRFTKDGRVIDVRVSAAVLFGHAGQRTGSVVHLRDITARKQAESDLAGELKKFQGLYDLALAMISERSLDEKLSLVVESARKLLSAEKAFIALRDPLAGDLYMHSLSGIATDAFKRLRIPLGSGLGGKVAVTGHLHIVRNYFEEVGPAFHEVALHEGLVSGIAVPVLTGKTNHGVLYVFHTSSTSYSKSDVDTLSLLGNLAALEINRIGAQEKLRHSEDRYRHLYQESQMREELYVSLLNSSPDAIVIYDIEGRVQYVSPSFTRTFGWSMEELQGQHIPFLPESERATTMGIIAGLIRDGTPTSGYETKRYTKDGRLLDISISASRNRDHEGKPVGTLVILRDISDRKRAEDALRESEERFRTLAEVAPLGLVIVAPDETTEYVNPKFSEMFGYAAADLPDASSWFGKAYPSERSKIAAESIWRAETSDIKNEYGIGNEARPRIFAVKCKDGTVKTASFRGVVLPNGRLIATFLDVTAEVRAQEKILQAKNEWERTFHAVSDLIVILDDQHRIARVNKAMADRLGKTPEEVIGVECVPMGDEAKSPVALCPDINLLSLGNEYSMEVEDENLGGVFDLRVSPLHDETGHPIGSVNVARDVTAFKSMERARRRAVHHLAHELKTPLAVIKSSVKNLGSKTLSEEARAGKLDRIHRNLQRLTDIQHIVQEIVAARPYHATSFPLIPAVHELLDEIRTASAHRQVELVPHLEPVETDTIDPYVFRQVIASLVKNAVENTPDEGTVAVHLTGIPTGILLQVEDRGIGIRSRDREFVFKAFHHTQSTSRYSTRQVYDFNAGGKGLELMRWKILSEDGRFELFFESTRCRHIREGVYDCPGRISLCTAISDVQGCRTSGGTTFSVRFPGKAGERKTTVSSGSATIHVR
jgi:PAS domain S-box-containing protein